MLDLLCHSVLHLSDASCYLYFVTFAAILQPWSLLDLPSFPSSAPEAPAIMLLQKENESFSGFSGMADDFGTQKFYCEQFANALNVQDAVVSTAFYRTNDTITYPGRTATVSHDLCRLMVDISIADADDYKMEAWLPSQWNNRLITTEAEPADGIVDYSALYLGLQLGFAAVGTNKDFKEKQNSEIWNAEIEGLHLRLPLATTIIQEYYGIPPLDVMTQTKSKPASSASGLWW